MVFVIEYNCLVIVDCERREKLQQPFDTKSITSLIIATNTPTAAALELDEEIETKLGISHIILETKSLGLLMRYVLDNTSIKLDFADSFSLNCEGCLEDFQFASMRTLLEVNHKLYSSNRFILPS